MVFFSLLQQIFPTQESNWCPALQADPLQLSYQGRPEHRQAKFKAMPPGEERLGDLQVISQPPLSTPTSQPMEHPDENEVYIRGRSLSEGTVLQGLTSFPWPQCPPGSAVWLAPLRKASSFREVGWEEKTHLGGHSSSSVSMLLSFSLDSLGA